MSEPGYRWDSQDYARHSAAQAQWAQELIAKMELRGAEAILDIGSGDGKITAALAARVPGGGVLGLDSSPEMVEQALRTYPPDRHPNLRFLLGNALELDFERRFDLVFSNATLHWVRDHLRVLRGVARALKPGGRPWAAWLGGLPFPYSFHGPQEYHGWLEQAGLRARRVQLLPKQMRQQGAEGLAVRTTWLPYTQAVPAERREELVSRIVERYLRDHPPGADGVVTVEMVRLEVEAFRP
ncbi:MAG: hypothetical protein A2V99_05580 [Spirochaetes bacterium RBG_16_67_19]|nr:MAG: hypothetical protein A2V99_05580 [Spirochaetes bacterium RBG_16_67_19]